MTTKRKVRYQWRLREVMAAHGMFAATDLAPRLAERGITLSAVQVWRLVTQTQSGCRFQSSPRCATSSSASPGS